MIIIDHWKCTSCGDDFEASVRRLEELVLIPECPWCGSFRTQLKLRWEEERIGRNYSPFRRRRKMISGGNPESKTLDAWKGGKAYDGN